MKRWIIGITMVGAVAGMVGVAGAQESQPPLRIQSTLAPAKTDLAMGIAAKPTKAAAKKETYLGATTSVASTAMREQLKLTKGVGLVVDAVEPKSPAELAGIKQHDVIEKLNDQWLVNVEQFGALLRSMKSGDEVKLSVIRQGERKEIKAKLEEREGQAGVGDLILIGPPDAAANWTPWQAAGAGVAPAPMAPRTIVADRAFTRLAGTTLIGNVVIGEVDGKQTTEWSDDQVRISLERLAGKTTKVTMKDRTGKVLFDGAPPAAGDELFKARPELAEKLKKAEEASTAQPIRVFMNDDGNGGVRPVVVRGDGGAGMVMGGGGGFVGGGGGRGKVMRWQDDNHILVMRMIGAKPTYLLALSKKDGRTIYDGAVMTDEQRQSVPTEVAESFEMVSAHPEQAKEFGSEDKK